MWILGWRIVGERILAEVEFDVQERRKAVRHKKYEREGKLVSFSLSLIFF